MPHFRFCALAALALIALPFAARADYLGELQQQAHKQGLSATREWLDLVHYRPDLLGGYTSLADSASFFNAPDGKTDPRAELDATLAAFFDTTPDPQTQQPRQCRFIARYHWLQSRLHFDPARLPEQRCKRFNAWYSAIAPRGVTLIYPSAFLNGPSSMFGHTLLRIDSGDHPGDPQLFSYALNYAAATDESNGVVFAIKGLFGGYPGYFSTAPYYEKVKEYNDLENRDIWEYELNYTPQELQRLLEHAWELGQVDFDYYFFKENCSYQLLALMDVARPGENLVDHFRGWAIPSDTVRKILAEEGLLRAVHYRPSNLTRIRHERAALTPAEQESALALAKSPAPPEDILAKVSPERRASVVDLAYDYLQYRAATEHLPRDKVAGPSMALLRTRAKLPPGNLAVEAITPPDRPDLGHGTARIAIGAGRRGNDDYLEIRLRPAYHDLVDPPSGYTAGAQINFLDTTVRAKGPQDVELYSFRLVDIFSVTGRDDFFHPWSWRITAALERPPLLGLKNPELAPTTGGSYGMAFALNGKATVFAFLDGLAVASDHLPDDYSVGAGPYVGISVQDTRATLLAGARTRRFSGVWEWMTDYTLEAGYTLDRNLALRVGVERIELQGDSITDTTIGLHGYF